MSNTPSKNFRITPFEAKTLTWWRAKKVKN